ncbi:MAG: glycosyltransferase family 2 protein, partial [Bacteroidota bacterium]
IEARYYVILNSDIEVTENWLSPLKKCLEEDDLAIACMPKMKSYYRRNYFEYAGAAGGFIDKYGYPFCRGRIMDAVEEDKGQYDETSDIFWATGACMFVRADLFHQLGGFDEDFFAHMEEIDLCWRLKKMGYTIKYVPESVVYHVGGGTLPNENPFKLFLNYRNNLFLLYKNLPEKQLFPVMCVRILMDWLSAFMFLLQGKTRNFTAVLRSHRIFLSSLNGLKEKRKSNPPSKNDFPGQVFHGSIVFQYFLKRRRRFSQLKEFSGNLF